MYAKTYKEGQKKDVELWNIELLNTTLRCRLFPDVLRGLGGLICLRCVSTPQFDTQLQHVVVILYIMPYSLE